MSSWKFDMRVNVKIMDTLIQRADNVDETLYKICDDIVDEIVGMIEMKDIIDTGALRDSITHEAAGKNARVIRDGVSYGVYNEFGTYKMMKRPFFVPALEKAGEVTDRWFTELLKI